jgi:hypothetical protein
VVSILVVASAIGGALAGCHPTGVAVVDALYGAALAAVVTMASAVAGRSSLLVLATVAAMLSRGWLTLPAGVALALAFAAVLAPRPYRRLGALIGALSVQVILRWPSVGFHGATALLAVVALTPVLVSGWRKLRPRHRSHVLIGAGGLLGLAVVLSLPAAVSAVTARDAARAGTDAARQALDDIASGKATAAVTNLKTAAANLGRVHRRTVGWWSLGTYLVPVVAQQQRAITQVTGAGRDLAASAATEAAAIDFQTLKYRQGQVNLSAVRALVNPVNSLKKEIGAAQAVVERNQSPWLIGPLAARIGTLRTELAKAGRESDLATLAVNDAPALLGADGERHYFVAFMTPAETRGLGGFIGAYGELTADQGRIALIRSGQATHLVVKPSPSLHLTGPADYLARYGAFKPQDNFEDLTYSPDFPSVERVIADLYPQVGGDQIDGVLVLDPYALGALLHFTGPVSVPGLNTQLTPSNAAAVLLRQQYTTAQANSISVAQRHDFLQAALAAAFRQLTTGSLPDPETLATTLAPMAHQGRLLFWSSHPADQPLLARLGLEGSFPQPGPARDVLAVTVANAANNKIDAYLQEHVADSVRYNPARGGVSSTVTVGLNNSAPAGGLPDDVIGSFSGSGLPPGTNYAWLSVYSPLALTSATVDGKAVPLPGSIPELGVRAYSLFVTTPARSASTVKLTFSGDIDPGSSYGLDLRLQPLASTPSLSVSVTPVAGWIVPAGQRATWAAGSDQVQQHRWRFNRA